LAASRWSADTSQELSREDERAVDGGIRVYFFCADPRPPPCAEFGNCHLDDAESAIKIHLPVINQGKNNSKHQQNVESEMSIF